MNETREDRAAAAKARMMELAAKFLARSQDDLDAMRASLAKVASGEAGALADIRHLAHRMCGTGATLGFEALADCAMRVERQPDESRAGAQLETALAELGAELVRLRQAAC